MPFPETKYMGSKRAILPFLLEHLKMLHFASAMDAFSGSGCVAYAMKLLGKRVIANDFHNFAFHIANASIQNSSQTLTQDDLAKLLQRNREAGTFVRDTYSGLYFPEEDCEFIDNTRANIDLLPTEAQRSLAIASLCRACMKKRPRGIFTFVGSKGWDGRRDLRISMQQQFIEAVQLFNAAVFSNRRKNRATCLDVFATSPKGIDLIYIDPPYISPHSDCDYTRRYHFVEGLCTYWKGLTLQDNTVTRKFASYPTDFKSAQGAEAAFTKLFSHFQSSILVVSYGSNGVPDRDGVVRLMRQFKRHVQVYHTDHKYCFGNHAHRIGRNNNSVSEFLFIGT